MTDPVRPAAARVGYVLKKFPRLSETFVLGELLAQQALGTDLVVFSRRPADDEPRHPELAQLAAPVVELPHPRSADPFEILIADGADGDLLRRLGDALGPVRALDHPRLGSIVTEALLLHERCAAHGVAHLHAHFATDSALVAHLVHALGGPTYSITAHAKDIYRDGTDPRLLELLIGASSFTVTVCDANVTHLEGLLSSRAAARVRRHYNGIERPVFTGLSREPEPGRLLSVGRLVPKKGFDVLIAAFHRLAAERPEVELHVVGQGDELARLEALASDGAGAGRIHFRGPLAADAVRDELRRAAVFALPCRVGADGNKDALPTVLLEAQAAGVPILSTPVAGVPEILDGGRAGLLVPEDDPGATAEGLARLLDDPGTARRLVEHGRALGEREFDREVQGGVLHGWFRAAVSAGASGARDDGTGGNGACASRS